MARLSQYSYPVAAAGIGGALVAFLAWVLRYTPSSRHLPHGIRRRSGTPGRRRHRLCQAGGGFHVRGRLDGLAALLNSVRFNQIPANAGLGLEMQVIAAVVVGGASITVVEARSWARCWACC
jgi:rhamnose transport system permease protein